MKRESQQTNPTFLYKNSWEKSSHAIDTTPHLHYTPRPSPCPSSVVSAVSSSLLFFFHSSPPPPPHFPLPLAASPTPTTPPRAIPKSLRGLSAYLPRLAIPSPPPRPDPSLASSRSATTTPRRRRRRRRRSGQSIRGFSPADGGCVGRRKLHRLLGRRLPEAELVRARGGKIPVLSSRNPRGSRRRSLARSRWTWTRAWRPSPTPTPTRAAAAEAAGQGPGARPPRRPRPRPSPHPRPRRRPRPGHPRPRLRPRLRGRWRGPGRRRVTRWWTPRWTRRRTGRGAGAATRSRQCRQSGRKARPGMWAPA